MSSINTQQPFLPEDVTDVYLVGDLHAFYADSDAILRDRIGATGPNWRLPEGSAVIQVGDLLHKGNDGEQLVDQVDRAIAENSGRWIQLWGNHEASVIQGGPAEWTRWVVESGAPPEADSVLDTLDRWWNDREALVAAAFTSHELGDVLVTHAGLSHGWWNLVGSPDDAYACAHVLNHPVGNDIDAAFGGGRLLHHEGPSPAAGPVWNDTAAEGWGQWLAVGDTPFTQVHGHANPWSWRGETWFTYTPDALKEALELDLEQRRSSLALPSGQLISIDTTPHHASGIVGDPVLHLTVDPTGADARSRVHELVAA